MSAQFHILTHFVHKKKRELYCRTVTKKNESGSSVKNWLIKWKNTRNPLQIQFIFVLVSFCVHGAHTLMLYRRRRRRRRVSNLTFAFTPFSKCVYALFAFVWRTNVHNAVLICWHFSLFPCTKTSYFSVVSVLIKYIGFSQVTFRDMRLTVDFILKQSCLVVYFAVVFLIFRINFDDD